MDVPESAGPHRYWGLRFVITFESGGFYGGWESTAFMLWEGTLPG
jgi:hypothetical protein